MLVTRSRGSGFYATLGALAAAATLVGLTVGIMDQTLIKSQQQKAAKCEGELATALAQKSAAEREKVALAGKLREWDDHECPTGCTNERTRIEQLEEDYERLRSRADDCATESTTFQSAIEAAERELESCRNPAKAVEIFNDWINAKESQPLLNGRVTLNLPHSIRDNSVGFQIITPTKRFGGPFQGGKGRSFEFDYLDNDYVVTVLEIDRDRQRARFSVKRLPPES